MNWIKCSERLPGMNQPLLISCLIRYRGDLLPDPKPAYVDIASRCDTDQTNGPWFWYAGLAYLHYQRRG